MMKGDLIEIRKEKSEGRNWNLKICRSVSDTWIIVNRSVGVVRTENRSNLEKVADRYLAIIRIETKNRESRFVGSCLLRSTNSLLCVEHRDNEEKKSLSAKLELKKHVEST